MHKSTGYLKKQTPASILPEVIYGDLFSSPAKQGAAARLNSGICALAVDKSLGVLTREKVSQIQDIHSPDSGFPSSGQLPASQEPVTATNIPVPSFICLHNGSEITS